MLAHTAQFYLRSAEWLSDISDKCETVSLLPPTLLYLLSALKFT